MSRPSPAFDMKFARSLRKGVATAAVAASLLSVTALPALAQATQADIAAQQQIVAQNPNNVRAWFDLAMMQKEAGQKAEAVESLKRVKEMRPDLARADLEIAMLQYSLGNYAEARPHFETAKNSPEASPELAGQIDLYLKDIDRRLAPSSTHGNIVVGVSYQTNANGGTDEVDDGPNAGLVEEEDDFNIFISGGVNHIQKVTDDGRITWDTSARGYASVQFDVDEVNAFLGEVNSGFTFGLGSGRFNRFTLRPYVKLNHLFLGDSSYRTGYSGGLGMGIRPSDTFALGLGYEYTYNNYYSSGNKDNPQSGDRPFAEDRTGDEHQVHATAAVAFTKQDSLTFRVEGGFVTGDVQQFDPNPSDDVDPPYGDFWDYETYGASLRYAHRFTALTMPGDLAGSISAGVAYTNYEYDAANLKLFPDEVEPRDEDRWRFDASATVPFTSNVGLLAGVAYTTQDSNVDQYTFDNFQATLGAAVSF